MTIVALAGAVTLSIYIYMHIYIYIYIYTYIYIEFVYAQTLSLFTPQTLHPDILRKQMPQTWHHVFLPTYGRAEADDVQRLKLEQGLGLLYRKISNKEPDGIILVIDEASLV